MSSSSRFQSRIFSYLSQQRLRLQDQSQRFWRQTQLTAIWSAQILLYPIYVGFQTTRLLTNQVGRAVQHIFPSLNAAPPPQPPPVDQPVLKTLAEVQGLLLEGTSEIAGGMVFVLQPSSPVASPPSPLAPPRPQTLQGLASLLATRSLVLVSTQNEILDILTQEQQWQLQRRIVWELAGYWRDRRLFYLANRPANFLPPPAADQPYLLPPVRAFLQLMGWMQRGQVAIATNLFQESVLALYFSPDPGAENLDDEGTEAWLTSLLNTVPAEEQRTVGAEMVAGRSPAPLPATPAGEPDIEIVLSRAPAMPEVATMGEIAVTSNDTSPQVKTAIAPPNSTAVEPYVEPYIDTEVRLVSYVKHPLEQLLEWLDTGMLWLEERWIAVWHWLTKPRGR